MIIKPSDVPQHEHEHGRQLFIVEGIAGSGQVMLTGGAFLAGFINLLKGSDQLIGLISVIPVLLGVFQIISPLIFEKLTSRKKTILRFLVPIRVAMALTYLLPIILMPFGISLYALVFIYALTYGMNAFIAPAFINWLAELTPESIRGRYIAKRQKLSLVITSVLTIILSKLLDYTESIGRPYMGFVMISIVLVFFGLLSIYSVSHIEETGIKKVTNTYNILDVFRIPLRSQKFRMFLLFFSIWQFSLLIGSPFMQVYMVKDLDLPYIFIMSMWVVRIVISIMLAKSWGKATDKNSPYMSAKKSIMIIAFVHLMWGFVSTDNYIWLLPLLHVLVGIGSSGMSIAMFGLQFLTSEEEGRTMYLGLKAFFAGFLSFIAVTIGGQMLLLFKEGLVVFGHSLNAMQVVFILSGLLMLICPMYIHFFLEKEKVKEA